MSNTRAAAGNKGSESVLEAASKFTIRFFLFQFAVHYISFLYQNYLLQSEAADLN